MGPIQLIDILEKSSARVFQMPDLASAHPSSHFCIIGTFIFIKQLLNTVVTKYMKMVIFR